MLLREYWRRLYWQHRNRYNFFFFFLANEDTFYVCREFALACSVASHQPNVSFNLLIENNLDDLFSSYAIMANNKNCYKFMYFVVVIIVFVCYFLDVVCLCVKFVFAYFVVYYLNIYVCGYHLFFSTGWFVCVCLVFLCKCFGFKLKERNNCLH